MTSTQERLVQSRITGCRTQRLAFRVESRAPTKNLGLGADVFAVGDHGQAISTRPMALAAVSVFPR